MNNKMAMNIYLSTLTLNVNSSSVPSKSYMLVEWITKQDPYLCCLEESHFRSKDTQKLKVKEWKRYFMKMQINKEKSWCSNNYTIQTGL